jgi:starch-binding outer membrane protein, SusD/RagB family
MCTKILRNCLGFAFCVSALSGCSALEVNDPTFIESESLDNATGAGYLLTVARWRLAQATNRSAFVGGVMTDEIFADLSPYEMFNAEMLLDRRESSVYFGGSHGPSSVYGVWQILRKDATVAIPRVTAYGERTHVGELLALRAYAALQLAENICPGFPLREINGAEPVFGPPLSTQEAFTIAVQEFDSALVYADSARVKNFANLGKARALLGLGRFAEAAAAAAAVPTAYSEEIIPDANQLFLEPYPWGAQDYSAADRQGGNGLNFISAADPRVALTPTVFAVNDTTFLEHSINKYASPSSPIVIANGIEARLIEAEAQLQSPENPSGPWLQTLNALRATVSLPDTTDPGTANGRVDLLYRERAFWLFATGHRLGDLRRLMTVYGRAAETLFPTGAALGGARFETATSLPFNPSIEQVYNPAVVGCTDI